MTSLNFIVHIAAALALLALALVMIEFRKDKKILINMTLKKDVKRLYDPIVLLLKLFRLSEIAYEADLEKYELRLVDLYELGRCISKIHLDSAEITLQGERPTILLRGLLEEDVDVTKLTSDLEAACMLDFKITNLRG